MLLLLCLDMCGFDLLVVICSCLWFGLMLIVMVDFVAMVGVA